MRFPYRRRNAQVASRGLPHQLMVRLRRALERQHAELSEAAIGDQDAEFDVVVTILSSPETGLTAVSVPVVALYPTSGAKLVEPPQTWSLVPESVDPVTLADVVLLAADGFLVRPASSHATSLGAHGLSVEDVELLNEISSGSRILDIADRLGYAERTIYRRLDAIYERLGVGSRQQALVKAVRMGIIQSGPN